MRLDVAVDDSGLVQRRQTLRDCDHERDQLLGRNRPGGKAIG
jgi:hypothetical protein